MLPIFESGSINSKDERDSENTVDQGFLSMGRKDVERSISSKKVHNCKSSTLPRDGKSNSLIGLTSCFLAQFILEDSIITLNNERRRKVRIAEDMVSNRLTYVS